MKFPALPMSAAQPAVAAITPAGRGGRIRVATGRSFPAPRSLIGSSAPRYGATKNRLAAVSAPGSSRLILLTD